MSSSTETANSYGAEEDAHFREDDSSGPPIIYTCKIRRGGVGVGFGLAMVKDISHNCLRISRIFAGKVDLVSIDASAHGKLAYRDGLWKINGIDVSDLEFSETFSLLSQSKVPVGSVVDFTFVRFQYRDKNHHVFKSEWEEKAHRIIYHANIKRGPKGVGFGLVLSKDQDSRCLRVVKVSIWYLSHFNFTIS